MSSTLSTIQRICGLSFAAAACASFIDVSTAIASPYSDAVLADSPLAYYRLQETAGTVAANIGTAGATLNGSTATFANAQVAPSTQPQIGQPGPRPTDLVNGLPLVGFEADNVGIRQTNNNGAQGTVPDNALLDITGALTLEAWVKKNATQVSGGNNEGIIGKFLGSGDQRSYALAVANTGSALQFIVNTTGASAGNTTYSPAGYALPAGGDWVHIVGVYVPSTSITVYVNGAVVGTPQTTGVPAAIFAGTADLWIGRQFSATATNVTFEGLIDEVAIYNTALSAERVAAHYNAAVPEPAGVVLAIFGLTAAVAARRKLVR
jgi:hypothetical protein